MYRLPEPKKCSSCGYGMRKDWRKIMSHLWICRNCEEVV